jgi:hypothetical protein
MGINYHLNRQIECVSDPPQKNKFNSHMKNFKNYHRFPNFDPLIRIWTI